jgi:endonuclease/exonuclease/phosphatase family metal-dependent hydrolase
LTHTVEARVVTANAAGGRPGMDVALLGRLLAEQRPDFVCLQELVVLRQAGEPPFDLLGQLLEVFHDAWRGETFTGVFRATVDTLRHAEPAGEHDPEFKWRKPPFLGCDYAGQGLGFIVRDTWEIGECLACRVDSSERFLGNRDTEPRYLLLLPVTHRQTGARLMLGSTHLTTLKGERDVPAVKGQPAQVCRSEQVARLVAAVEEHAEGAVVLLGGDFNAGFTPPRPGAKQTGQVLDWELEPLTRDFARLTALDYLAARSRSAPTHPCGKVIDHLWLRPAYRLVEADSWMVAITGLAASPTDHAPVVARVRWYR